MNYGIGSYGLSDYDGVCSPVYIVLKPQNDVVESRFAFRVLENRAFQTYAQSFGNGILEHRCAINWDILKPIGVGIPPISEQQRILAFLDGETAKIDALMGEQRRLIELLKEKRQAVISHAVTRGLNPHAPLKPSGIEWLGDVPAHWKVGKAGFYTRILSGFAFPSAGFTNDPTNEKLLRGINVGVGRIKWQETVYWKRTEGDGLDLFSLQPGDLVIGMDRPWISEGVRVAKISAKDLPCLLLQRVAAVEPSEMLHPDYLMYFLGLGDIFNAHFAPETTGVSVPHISPEQIRDCIIPIPPFDEQEEVVKHIAENSSALDALTAVAERAIDLLQERRSVLISATVTGKIDVRNA